jgi:general stress protein 26
VSALGRWAGRIVRSVGVRRARAAPADVLTAAVAVMRAKKYCLLVTTTPAGTNARVVQPFRPRPGSLAVHIGTAPQSRKVAEMRETGEALLVYERDRDAACVVAHCTAEILDDEPARERWFMPTWRAFWPDGPDTVGTRDQPGFVVVRLTPYALEVWDGRRGITPRPFGLASARLERDGDNWRHPAEN